jgi:hypothetical protein
MLRIILSLTICALVAGCATEARVNEYQACRVQGNEKFPVNSVPQNYTEIEYFQRQEGMTCTRIPSGFYNAGGMECEPNMRTYQRQVQKTRYIDANASSRNSWIEQCANQQCISKFGNSDCEIKEKNKNLSSENNSSKNIQKSLNNSLLERYKKEVESGNSNSQFNLGLFYQYGQIVEKDKARAYMWFHFAEKNGHQHSRNIKDTLRNEMTNAEKENSQKMITECIKNLYKNCGI